MRALVKAKGEKGLWLEERPMPDIGPRDVLIRVQKAAICGTDLHIYNWDKWAQDNVPLGTIIGHEFMGVIEEVGTNVPELKIGTRVAGEGHVFCGTCRNCRQERKHLCSNLEAIGINRDGAFADYITLHARNVFPLEDSISDDMGAIADPLGNATHTALTFEVAGEDVVILGAGPIGIMAAAICQRLGAHSVTLTDIDDYRLELAHNMGIRTVVNTQNISLSQVAQTLHTDGFGVALEMSGSLNALESAIDAVVPGGRIALLGILPDKGAIDWSKVVFKGLTLKGVYGRKIFKTWYRAFSFLDAGLDLTTLITHEAEFEQFATAFSILESQRAGKVILNMA